MSMVWTSPWYNVRVGIDRERQRVKRERGRGGESIENKKKK
jgi:hypothetical protein